MIMVAYLMVLEAEYDNLLKWIEIKRSIFDI